MTTFDRVNNAHSIAIKLAPILCQQVLYKKYKQIIKKIEFIHSGKYGTVSLAQLRGTRNELAIKTIHMGDRQGKSPHWDQARDSQSAFSVWSEALINEILSQVVINYWHPGFAIMHGWMHTIKDDNDNHFRLCMEVSNGNLKDWLWQYNSTHMPKLAVVYSLIVQTLTALLVMGRLGICHNDLYDRNIVFENTNEEIITFKSKTVNITFATGGLLFKIVDFGMASAPMAGNTDFMPEAHDSTFQVDHLTQSQARHIIYAKNIPIAARDLLTLLWMFANMAATWDNINGRIVGRYINSALSYTSICIGKSSGVFSLNNRNAIISDLLSCKFLKWWPKSVRIVANTAGAHTYNLGDL